MSAKAEAKQPAVQLYPVAESLNGLIGLYRGDIAQLEITAIVLTTDYNLSKHNSCHHIVPIS